MELSPFAPVIIPTLCRYDHFRRCVESLSRCTHASETDLFIALDYPLKDAHRPGYEQLKEYIPTITGFRSVTVHSREHNIGCRQNIADMRDYCFSLGYDRYILSEDDNEFAPNFLDYINKGLNLFEDNPSVYAVSGYTPPVEMKDYTKNAYATYNYSAWGVGLWKSKLFIHTRQWAISILHSPRKSWKIFRTEPRVLYTLLRMINKHMLYGDTCTVAYSILNGLYSVAPTVSKVRNWGNDGSGINCVKISDTKYEDQMIDTAQVFDFDDITVENINMKSLNHHASLMWQQWVKFPYQILRFWLLNA